MRIERLDVDSDLLGRSVLAIHDFEPAADFSAFERGYVAEFNPAYVSVKVPFERVTDAHVLEANGFRLMECQLRCAVKLRKPYDLSSFPYDFTEVTRQEDLAEVLQIA